jgi:hypothetical protein
MAKSIFLTSSAAVASNKSIVDECVSKQCLPEVLRLQLGNKTIALPTNGLGASIWAIIPREDGGFSLKVSVYGYVANGVICELPAGEKSNFKLGGWLTCYPEGVDAPANARILSESELKGILGFSELNQDGSKKSLWFDLNECPRVYLVAAITEESHYVRDDSGNKVPTGEIDSQGRPLHQLATHKVISFPLAKVAAPISGSGVSTLSISDEACTEADNFLDQLLATAPAGRSL